MNKLLVINTVILIFLFIAILAGFLEIKKSRLVVKESERNDSLLEELYLFSIANSGIKINDVYVFDGKSEIPTRLYDKLYENTLIFRFSGEACNTCIDYIVKLINDEFPDYSNNEQIIFIGSNLNKRVLEGYYGKNIQYLKGEDLGMPTEEYYLPGLMVVNRQGTSVMGFVPDKSYPQLTESFLRLVNSRYFNNKQ